MLCRHYASWCIPLKRKVNAVNYAKLSMLHRISGGSPIAVNASNDLADLQKLYDYLQELCDRFPGYCCSFCYELKIILSF